MDHSRSDRQTDFGLESKNKHLCVPEIRKQKQQYD